MTREEAIEILRRELPDFNGKDKDIARIFPEVVIALDMAIKALEAEGVLDKIRAEIMDFEEELFNRPNTDYADYAAVRHCVEIIDKYKAESEDN